MPTHDICVLGGTGFVGRNLVARLAADGHRIVVPTRYSQRGRDLRVLPTVTVVEANIHNRASLEHLFANCDTVINLVGILFERSAKGGSFADAHAKLPATVVEACRAAGVRRLLHMSALKADAGAPSRYLRSKAEGEAAVLAAADALNVTIFRPSVIFGPDDSFINRFADMLRAPLPLLPLPRPNARFAPVYVGDVVGAFATCLDRRDSFGETYQLCGPQVLSLREIVTMVAGIIGVRRRIVGMGDSVSRLMARILEFAPGKPMTVDNFDSMSVNSICDSNGFAALDIRPRPAQAIVPRYLAGRSLSRRLSAYRERARR